MTNHSLVATAAAFTRHLRTHGVPVTPSESIDAARVLEHVDLGDREDVYLGLRAALTTRHEDVPVFDAAFAEYWRLGGAPSDPADAVSRGVRRPLPALRPRRAPAVSLENWMRPGDATDGESVLIRAASDLESWRRPDVSKLGDESGADLRKLVRQMVRRLSSRPSRRWRPRRRGERLDLRRTVRRSLRTSGDAIELARRTRAVRRTRLVVLCDVSGSMALYADFLLRFVHAMQQSVARVETFSFSTRLSRITPSFRRRTFGQAMDSLADEVTDWSAGTRIGSALGSFARGWLHLVDRGTTVVILSDGWDAGDPATLEWAMRRIRRRARRILWLNPLAGSPGYAPAARGMQTALPFIDALLPAHNLESLWRLVRALKT